MEKCQQEALGGENDKRTPRYRVTSSLASESLCMTCGRDRSTVLQVISMETSSSDRLLEAEQTPGGAVRGRRGVAPTFALESVGGGGEQESVSHGLGAAAAGDARLLVPRLHPLRQPTQAAVTVQRVGSQSPRRQSRRSGPPHPT